MRLIDMTVYDAVGRAAASNVFESVCYLWKQLN
jgi:hypothetical protein